MRKLLACMGLVVGWTVALPTVARADLISISISANDLTGSLGGQDFSNNTLTITATLTTAQYAACRQDPTCFSSTLVGGGPDRHGYYAIPRSYFDSVTAEVSGIGTFDLLGPITLNVFDYQNMFLEFSLLPQGMLGAPGGSALEPDGTYDLTVPERAFDYYGKCFTPCSAETSGGTLTFQQAVNSTGYPDSRSTSEITVMPEGTAVTPEPGTWVMVGTGLLGGVGAVRRLLGR